MKISLFAGLVFAVCVSLPGQQTRIVGPDGGTTWIYDHGNGTKSVQHAGGGTSWVYGDMNPARRNNTFTLERQYGTFSDGFQQAQDNIYRSQVLDLQRDRLRDDSERFDREMAQRKRERDARHEQYMRELDDEIRDRESRSMAAQRVQQAPPPVVVEDKPVIWGMSAQAIKLAYRLMVLERVVKMTEEKIEMPGLWDFVNEQVDRIIDEEDAKREPKPAPRADWSFMEKYRPADQSQTKNAQ